MLSMGKTEKWTLSKQEFDLILMNDLVLTALVCLLLEIILYG